MKTAWTGISRDISWTAERIASATSSARISKGLMKITISASIPSHSLRVRMVAR